MIKTSSAFCFGKKRLVNRDTGYSKWTRFMARNKRIRLHIPLHTIPDKPLVFQSKKRRKPARQIRKNAAPVTVRFQVMHRHFAPAARRSLPISSLSVIVSAVRRWTSCALTFAPFARAASTPGTVPLFTSVRRSSVGIGSRKSFPAFANQIVESGKRFRLPRINQKIKTI